jgi:hypothetical protein
VHMAAAVVLPWCTAPLAVQGSVNALAAREHAAECVGLPGCSQACVVEHNTSACQQQGQ